MTKIQIVSDIHLEFRNGKIKGIIKPSAPILFLLGDISVLGINIDWVNFQNFINYIAPQFEHVFMVTGNHEYYTSNRNITKAETIVGIDIKLKQFAKSIKNFYVLNNNTMRLTIDKKKYVFIGTTLWTGVDPANYKIIQAYLNDYSMNWVCNEPNSTNDPKWKQFRHFTVVDMSKLHKKAVSYVSRELKKVRPDEIAILLTHHKPVRTKPIEDILTHGYETDLTKNIIKPPLVVACHGHTHVAMDKIINKVRILSNPLGYPGQRTKFNKSFVFTI